MKLGFWNRLALVVGAVGSIGGGTWMLLDAINDRAIVRQGGYEACMKSVAVPNSDLTTAECFDIWLSDQSPFGFEYWLQGVAAFALLSLTLYAIIWLAVWLCKWIWRGRSAKQA